jgi:glycosyltransferase involved in cell wall biosynthesis
MVSVCMTTYNGEKYLKKQVDSILSQLTDIDELIVSDDGSTDSTLDILLGYNDKRIKLLSHKDDNVILPKKSLIYRKIARNFEYALKYASGDYVFLSDQDDVWEDKKVKLMINELNYNDLVMCNINIINDKDIVLWRNVIKKTPLSKYPLLNLIYLPFRACCMAFKKRLLHFALPFPNNIVTCDSWIGCIASKCGTIGFIEEPLHHYRIHNGNVSNPFKKSDNSIFFRIKYRIDLLNNMYKRDCKL